MPLRPPIKARPYRVLVAAAASGAAAGVVTVEPKEGIGAMDDERFDGIAKAFAANESRRGALRRIAGGLLAGALTLGGVAGTDAAKKKGWYCGKCDKPTEKCVKSGKKWKCVPKPLPPPPPPPPPTCTPNGSKKKCYSGDDCCSGYCNSYKKCVKPPAPCVPKTCGYYGDKCGTFPDKCGATITCGCPDGYKCERHTCVRKKPPVTCGQKCNPYDGKITCPYGCYCKKFGKYSYKCAPKNGYGRDDADEEE